MFFYRHYFIDITILTLFYKRNYICDGLPGWIGSGVGGPRFYHPDSPITHYNSCINLRLYIYVDKTMSIEICL